MKRLVLYICGFFILASAIVCFGKIIGKGDTTKGSSSNNMFLAILYFSDAKGDYLVPEARKIDASMDKIEEAIIEELLRGPASKGLKTSCPDGIKFISVKTKGKITYVDLKDAFKESNGKEVLFINSVVNSLTEIPGVEGVQFSIGGKELEGPYKRVRSALIRENLNPSEVMKKQMSLEKKGDWLNAYTLMADDENNEGRKCFNDYVYEMEEARYDGLLDTGFEVGDYSIDPNNDNKAVVKVNFIIKDSDGLYVKGPDVYFDTKKVDGYWRVDWLGGQ